MKFLMNIFKRIFVSAFLLYGYNLIAVRFNMIIPINLYTISFIAILGIPSLLALLIFKVFIL